MAIILYAPIIAGVIVIFLPPVMGLALVVVGLVRRQYSMIGTGLVLLALGIFLVTLAHWAFSGS